VPAAHCVHVLADTAPTTVEKVPAEQELHTDAPLVEEKKPAVQETHVAADWAPVAVDAVPAAQLVQLDAPLPE